MLQTVYKEEPTSRADIARLTALTRPTVSELVAIPLGDGLVEELGPGPATHGAKPPTLVAAPTIDVTYSALEPNTVLLGGAATVLSAQLGVVW